MDEMSKLQINIYTRKFFRTLKRESIISIITGIVITLLVMLVIKKNMFVNFEGTKSGFFALICVCIWIGIFNSIQLVCREKNDIVKDELDKSLRATSYMAAHFIYQLALCAIQSLSVFIIFYMIIGSKAEFSGNAISYFITIFLVMYASDAMAFVLSSAVPTPIVAMTIMPLLLLIQLVMAGVLFPLEGMSETVANFTVSKWGMSAFGNIGSICDIPSVYSDFNLPRYAYINESSSEMFENTEVAVCWLILLVFIAAFYFLSVFALQKTTRRIKK